MEDRVGLVRILLERLDRFRRRHDEQLDVAMLGLALHVLHDRQGAVGPGADHQPAAFPGDLLRERQWRVSEGVAELFGGFLSALADFPAVNDHVVLVRDPVDPDRAKGNPRDTHRRFS